MKSFIIGILCFYCGHAMAVNEMPLVINVQISKSDQNLDVYHFESCYQDSDGRFMSCEVLGDSSGYVFDEVKGLRKYKVKTGFIKGAILGAGLVASVGLTAAVAFNPIGMVGSGIFILVTSGTSITPIVAMIGTATALVVTSGVMVSVDQANNNNELINRVLTELEIDGNSEMEVRETFTLDEVNTFEKMLLRVK